MEIKSQIESLLFVSAKPVSVKELASAVGSAEKEVQAACDELSAEYKERNGGINILKNSGKFQMVSAPETAPAVQAFLKDETTGELSRPSLEALTVIAYRGPITKIELERIRGVNCSMILRNLLMRGLVDAKEDKMKKETYYEVTFDFIRFLGISDVRELPDYERLNAPETLDKALAENGADN
jgi:segregation and condensation protein B